MKFAVSFSDQIAFARSLPVALWAKWGSLIGGTMNCKWIHTHLFVAKKASRSKLYLDGWPNQVGGGTVGCAQRLLKYCNIAALLEFASAFQGIQDIEMRTKDLKIAFHAYTSSQLLLLFVDCMWLHQVFVDWVTSCTWCTTSSWPREELSLSSGITGLKGLCSRATRRNLVQPRLCRSTKRTNSEANVYCKTSIYLTFISKKSWC